MSPPKKPNTQRVKYVLLLNLALQLSCYMLLVQSTLITVDCKDPIRKVLIAEVRSIKIRTGICCELVELHMCRCLVFDYSNPEAIAIMLKN